jgi:hypothetical protein
MPLNDHVGIGIGGEWLVDSRRVLVCFVLFFLSCAPVYWATSRVYRADLPDLTTIANTQFQVHLHNSSSITAA